MCMCVCVCVLYLVGVAITVTAPEDIETALEMGATRLRQERRNVSLHFPQGPIKNTQQRTVMRRQSLTSHALSNREREIEC